jgi:hypothetical protein
VILIVFDNNIPAFTYIITVGLCLLLNAHVFPLLAHRILKLLASLSLDAIYSLSEQVVITSNMHAPTR